MNKNIEKTFITFCEYLELLKTLYSEDDYKYVLKLFEMEMKFYE